ncbi:hypothetical protein F2P81_010041 [Scophthalmus maximus]|uniref:Uncharacterized protein n=1 Tax=Scophthalmus maximus TaxID=52904 RepID=A0A6A4SUN3_SCOMX|nr:hypothetical protein F2P81_010041 [Scophthalmus maximus]
MTSGNFGTERNRTTVSASFAVNGMGLRQRCLCGRGSLETLWPGGDLNETPPLMCCSEALFGARGRNLCGCPINY